MLKYWYHRDKVQNFIYKLMLPQKSLIYNEMLCYFHILYFVSWCRQHFWQHHAQIIYFFFILGSVYILDTIRLNPISVGNIYPQNLNKRFTTFLIFFSYYLLHHPGVLEILDLDLKDYHHFTNLGTFVFNFILIYLSI